MYMYTTVSLSTHPQVDTHCFQILAIVSNAAVNMRMQILFKLMFQFYLYKYPGVGLLEHMVALFLIF